MICSGTSRDLLTRVRPTWQGDEMKRLKIVSDGEQESPGFAAEVDAALARRKANRIEWSGPVPRHFLSEAKQDYYRRAMLHLCEVWLVAEEEKRRAALLAPRPMTPEQIADLVTRVKQNEAVASRAGSDVRWDRHRMHLADVEAMQNRDGVG